MTEFNCKVCGDGPFKAASPHQAAIACGCVAPGAPEFVVMCGERWPIDEADAALDEFEAQLRDEGRYWRERRYWLARLYEREPEMRAVRR